MNIFAISFNNITAVVIQILHLHTPFLLLIVNKGIINNTQANYIDYTINRKRVSLSIDNTNNRPLGIILLKVNGLIVILFKYNINSKTAIGISIIGIINIDNKSVIKYSIFGYNYILK